MAKAKEVVTNLSISKNESKSQLREWEQSSGPVVTNLSISKNESKSQPVESSMLSISSCYESQYFKE